MRRDRWHLLPLLPILLLFSTSSHGQAWSTVLASSRAIDWSHAGLPAALPDGETTANPWTPPVRTTICQSLGTPGQSPGFAQSVTAGQITNAVSSCSSTSHGSVVLLNPGTYTLSSGEVDLYGNNVTLRGSGPMQTKLILSGAPVKFGADSQGGRARLTSDAGNYAQGSTSINVDTVSGSLLKAGVIAHLYQCDTNTSGYTNGSGNHCQTGTSSDNGGLFICGDTSNCDIDGAEGTYNPRHQQQTIYVQSVTNNGSFYTITFTPGLYLPNWAFARTPELEWNTAAFNAIGMGLENMTIQTPSGGSGGVQVHVTYASWVTGVRFVGSQAGGYVDANGNKNLLFAHNYIFALDPAHMADRSDSAAIQQYRDSDNLFLNNIITYGFFEGLGFDSGSVIAYNYLRDSQGPGVSYPQNSEFQHQGSPNYMLLEGNQAGILRDDDTWGTHNFDTFFRNALACYDPPFAPGSNRSGIDIDSYARFENVIGNVIGTAPGGCLTYQSNSDSGSPVFRIGYTAKDPLTSNTLMRWGNVSGIAQSSDTPANSGVRFVSSEVPSSLPSPNTAFSNPLPGDNNLPASFFLGVTAHPSGGTGLSWWKVCTNWTAFPTNCATTQTPPFPAAGPDVSGGPYLNGFAWDTPAAIAWSNLPIDTSYQNTYSITGSSWSGGTETLTVSGLPGGEHLMGGFQVTGACAGGGVEYLMTNSNATHIMYALAADPGSCTGGTVKWPDVRQFDESVYQDDTSGGSGPPAPKRLSNSAH